MGARAYSLINNYKNLSGSVVEIGTDRGEGSTMYFAVWCHANNNKFYTVDFDRQRRNFSTEHPNLNINQFYMTGELFFNQFPNDEQICFAYLDGFDWIWDFLKEDSQKLPEWINEQIQTYKNYNLNMNNINSQISHLNLAIAVHNHASPKCIILIDDTFITSTDDVYSGKGGAAVTWLLANSWNLIDCGIPATQGESAIALKNW